MNDQESGSRMRPARITGGVVWGLMAMVLLVSGRLSEGQLMPAEVTMDAGKLSVSLRGARLHDVMEAITRLSGIQIIVVGPAGQTTLTESFSGLSLEDGLRRLLRAKNYIVTYSGTERESKIAKVFVLSRTGEAVEDSGEQTPSIAEVIHQALNTQQFAETMTAAIAAAGGMTKEDEAFEGTVDAELNSTFQRLLTQGSGAASLREQFQRLLQQRLQ